MYLKHEITKSGGSMNRKKTPSKSATKKTAKRVAKKTYKSAAKKKTVPELKGKAKDRKLTVETLAAVMSENHAKTEAIIAKSREETDKAIREALSNLSAENAKSREETDKALQETLRSVDKMSDKVDELSENIGHVYNRLGGIVEFIVVPKIRHAMNAAGGHTFDNIAVNREIKDIIGEEKKTISEMDVFLYGNTEAMAVEVKTNLTVKHVNDHVLRLKKLRAHAEKINIVEKKLFGAVVGAIVHPLAGELALANGLYVVEIREEEDKLKVEKPEKCQEW
jgi:hypothetical protein